MANFPTSAPNLKTNYVDNVDDVMAANQNTPNDEINKIAEKVGINGVGFNPASSSASANVVLHEDTDNGTNKITLTAPSAIASDKTITLPDETGTVLTTSSTISQGQLDSSYQYQIVPTVASNNLTVALKTLSGNDPSALDPVRIRIGNTIHSITSALSVTKNAGTNWSNAGSAELATKEIDYFVYLGYNATDGVVLGFSRIPYGALYSDFSATTTEDKYCAISTITNATASDVYTNIGRFAATLSAGAGYTWSVPTFTSVNLRQVPTLEAREITTATGKRIYVSGRTVRVNAFIFQTGNGSAGLQTVKAFAYPVTFSAVPSVLASYTGWKNGSDFVNFDEGVGGEFANVFAIDKTTSSCNVRFKSDTALSSAYRYGAHLEIFGTW